MTAVAEILEKDESLQDDFELLKEKVLEKKREIELKSKGFILTKAGFVLPNLNPESVKKALKKREVEEDLERFKPAVEIMQMNSTGFIEILFH